MECGVILIENMDHEEGRYQRCRGEDMAKSGDNQLDETRGKC